MSGRNAHYRERVQVVYVEDLEPLPPGIQARIRSGWRDLADLARVRACPHVADTSARLERSDRLRHGLYVCCAHPSAGVSCPGCFARHLQRPANDHRECRHCGRGVDPFAPAPARVDLAVDLADDDGQPVGTLQHAALRTLGWATCRRCGPTSPGR